MNQDDIYQPTAYWHKAEQLLLDSAEADVLAILDCHYAGNAATVHTEQHAATDYTEQHAVIDYTKQPETHRVYELIAASPKGLETPAPGEGSFTNHLIASLRELLGEHRGGSFTTATLVTTINKKHRKSHQELPVPVLLFDRLMKFSGRMIQLARQGNEAAESKQPVEAAHLKLRFSLEKSDLNEEQIQALAPKLQAAFEKAKLPLTRINWEHFSQNETSNLSDDENSTQKSTETAQLDLGFSLRNPDLDQAQIKPLTRNLTAAFQGANIPLSRID